MGGGNLMIVGVYNRILGDMQGGFLLTFPIESAYALADILLKKGMGQTKEIDEMDKSALEEAGNQITWAFINALSKMTNLEFSLSVPRMAVDMAGAIIDFILIELVEVAEYAMVLEILFNDVPETITGKFFIIPDPNLLNVLLDVADAKFK
jgi:chemotaxis protein CheC